MNVTLSIQGNRRGAEAAEDTENALSFDWQSALKESSPPIPLCDLRGLCASAVALMFSRC